MARTARLRNGLALAGAILSIGMFACEDPPADDPMPTTAAPAPTSTPPPPLELPPGAFYGCVPMATPTRAPSVEVLTLSSWVAAVGTARVERADGRSHFCSDCQRVVVDVDELLFSDGEPPLDFRTSLSFLVSGEHAPRRLDRGVWLWALGHWQRLELDQRERVLAARDSVVFRHGVPPHRTVVTADGRVLVSSPSYPEFPAVVAKLERGEVAELQRIRAEFRSTQLRHDSCLVPGGCSHGRVSHIWLTGVGSRVDDPALVEAASTFVENLRQRLSLHFQVHSSSFIVRAVVERVVVRPRRFLKYQVRVERELAGTDVAQNHPGSRGWVYGRAQDKVRPGDSIVLILSDALAGTTEEHPARSETVLLRSEWVKLDAVRRELAEYGVLARAAKM